MGYINIYYPRTTDRMEHVLVVGIEVGLDGVVPEELMDI